MLRSFPLSVECVFPWQQRMRRSESSLALPLEFYGHDYYDSRGLEERAGGYIPSSEWARLKRETDKANRHVNKIQELSPSFASVHHLGRRVPWRILARLEVTFLLSVDFKLAHHHLPV